MTVTAVCITYNRRSWLPQAIECFLRQTYPADLLILADGEDVADLIPADSRIRLVGLPVAPETIGEKRNIGCSLIESDAIVHWDDDDWYAPDRIADQVARLLSTGKAVTGYNSLTFSDGINRWRYRASPDRAAGTSLCYLRSWWEVHPFRHVQNGEDHWFVYQAKESGQLATCDADGRIIASIHSENTDARDFTDGQWEPLGQAG